MWKRNLKILMAAIICSMGAMTSLAAQEALEMPDGVLFGTHSFSDEEEIQFAEQKAKENWENLKNFDRIPLEERPFCKDCGMEELEEERIIHGAHYVPHVDTYHYPLSISSDGLTIETQDEAVFGVNPYDAATVRRWKTHWDANNNAIRLHLVPNDAWFFTKNYQLKFINASTREEVCVNILLTPVFENSKARWIIDIDYAERMVYLNDKSVWSMSCFDQSILDMFKVRDMVLIGTNNGWWRGSNPNVLIVLRFSPFKYVRGACIKSGECGH